MHVLVCLGFIKPKRKALSSQYLEEHEQLLTMQFEWRGAKKLVSTSLIGTSPEFEIALYTLCFFAEGNEHEVNLGPYKVLITSYNWPSHPRAGQQSYIATAFPAEVPLDENEVSSFHVVSVH